MPVVLPPGFHYVHRELVIEKCTTEGDCRFGELPIHFTIRWT
jgi:hypothetical protein